MSNAFKDTLSGPQAKRMLMEAKAYTHALPETLMVGAQHLLNWMEVKANADDLRKAREGDPKPTPSKGKLNG